MRAACMLLRSEGVRTMTLPRDEVVKGFNDEMAAFAELARSLDEAGWRAPTRCVGWSTGDLVGPRRGHPHRGGRRRVRRASARPEVTERHVAERRARSAGEVIAELTEASALGGHAARRVRRGRVVRPGPRRGRDDGRRRRRGALVRRLPPRRRHPRRGRPAVGRRRRAAGRALPHRGHPRPTRVGARRCSTSTVRTGSRSAPARAAR